MTDDLPAERGDDLPAPRAYSPVVTVFTTGDIGELALAKGLLEAEGIGFVTQGEGVQDLFGIGRLGAGYNPFTGPVELRVLAEDVARAREVLEGLQEGG